MLQYPRKCAVPFIKPLTTPFVAGPKVVTLGMRPRLLIQACLLGLAVLAGSCQDPASPSPKSKDEPSPGASATNDEDDAQKDALLDCDALVATGNDPGEVPVDLVRLASTGKEISLRSYCNQPLLVLSGTAYCSS